MFILKINFSCLDDPSPLKTPSLKKDNKQKASFVPKNKNNVDKDDTKEENQVISYSIRLLNEMELFFSFILFLFPGNRGT